MRTPRRDLHRGNLSLCLFSASVRGSLRRLKTLGVEHLAVRSHEYRIEVRQLLDDANRLIRAEHECGLREAIRLHGCRPEYRRAAHLAGGVPGLRVDDVVISHPVLIEEPLVIPRR